MKKQTKADKAFIAKVATINVGSKGGHTCGLKCPICGKKGHKLVGAGIVRIARQAPAREEQSFSA